MNRAPIAVLNEHPDWQRRLYAELDRRGVAWEELTLHSLALDPDAPRVYEVVLNRASPSAWKRDHASAIFFAQSALAHFEAAGCRVVNGARAYALETSKVLQTLLLRRLGVSHPRTRFANSVASVRAAAEGLEYPLVVKPNIGGSGAGIVRFDDRDALEAWLTDAPSFGVDGQVLVQEFHPAEGGHIVRVEMLGDRHLYSVRIFPEGKDFNLCPADICQVGAAPAVPAAPIEGDAFEMCAVSAPAKGLRIERHDETPDAIDDARRIAAAGALDVCGVEYLVSTRDGRRYVYDVNALSNFVRDAETVVGFDPTKDFVDWLLAERDRPRG